MKNTNPASDVPHTLGLDRLEPYRGHRKRWLVLAVLISAVVAAVIVWRAAGNTKGPRYITQPAERGNLTVIVTATGTLEPTNEVEVGSELSGIIEMVEVDYNDRVKEGQVLAKLDTDKLEAQVLQSKAALESAKAKVSEAKATVLEARLKLDRCEKLVERQLCPQEDVDTAQATYARAQAEEASTKAVVAEAQATLDANQTNLEKAVIHSPINGIVLDRNVESGQTVAASFQTPVLFTLAEDLTQMELHVDVDEADVGQVKEGQEATFTVDAYPDRRFPAHITQLRYGAQEVDGVITYETVLNVNNSDLFLRPGMTATADISVKQVEDALLVPTAALRFSPPAQQQVKRESGGSLISQIMPRPPRPRSTPREEVSTEKKQQQVWALRDGQPVAVSVTVGVTDGVMTEVIRGEVEPGMALIVDTLTAGR